MTRLVDDSGWIMTGGARPGRQRRRDRRRCAPAPAAAPAAGRSRARRGARSTRAAAPTSSESTSSSGDPVERLLERNRDQLLHFGRGQPEAGRLDLDPRRRELGEDVHRHVAKLPDAEDHQRRGDGDHEEPELQARSDDPTHHCVDAPCAVARMSAAVDPRCSDPSSSACADGHDLGPGRGPRGENRPLPSMRSTVMPPDEGRGASGSYTSRCRRSGRRGRAS